MKNFCALFSIISFSLLGNAFSDQLSFTPPVNERIAKPQLKINNRPLAKIHGKVISLYDVIKMIDMSIFIAAPTYTPSVFEKYQIYSSRWQDVLDEMITNELILLDAEDKGVKVSDGEVREKFLSRLGPNVHENLDKMNLEYEEARNIILSDLTVQKLLDVKVFSKTLQTVTPAMIKIAYKKYLKEHPSVDEWKYQVLSIRGKDELICKFFAEKAYLLLQEEKYSLEKVATLLQEENITIGVSKDFSECSHKISKLHFDVIKTLAPNTISAPVLQTSNFDNSTVFRIFYLKDVRHIPAASFHEIYDALKNQLLSKVYSQEKQLYIDTLKQRFGYNMYDPKIAFPEDYIPFFIL